MPIDFYPYVNITIFRHNIMDSKFRCTHVPIAVIALGGRHKHNRCLGYVF